jgi:putative spermidine/putrescine transport system permease protein
MMRLSSYQLLRAYAWLMMVFLVLPLLIVVGTSFNEGSAIMFPPQSVTLHWYAEVWSNTSMLQSAVNSLILAGGATFFSILIGVPAAIALVRHVGHAKELLQAFLLAPMTVPSIVLGIAFLIFYGWTGAGLSFTTLLISHVIVTLPYVIRSVAGVYLGVSPKSDAAADPARRDGGRRILFRHVF